MRVLHVLSGIDPRVGGPVAALVGLSTAQARAGLRVAVLATYCRGASFGCAESMRSAGIEVTLVGPCTRALSWHRGIAPACRNMLARADVVHVHALFEEVQHQAAQAARARGVPYLIRPCGMLDPWSLSQKAIKKRLYMAWRLRENLQQAAAIHYTTAVEAQNARPLRLRPAEIIEPNGVQLDEFRQLPEPGSFRARFPSIGNRRIVLFLSRIHKKKGLDLLIPAFARASLEETVLVLAGPDDEGYGAIAQRLLAEHQLEDRVIFTGMLHGAERVEALVDADLFALPSYTENFGIAVVEALAAGTPVLISDQVNICKDIAEAGVGGVVPLDISVLSAELRRWLTDEAMRKAAAARARPFVWDRYDWNQIAQRWIGHYERLTARP